MKKYVIILFLLAAGASYGQPVIDSMLIDEMKGELHIYGSFGTVQGEVSIDSVDMQIKNWSDSLISSSIPDMGRGSFGPVIITILGNASVPRMITKWDGYWHYIYTEKLSRQRYSEYALGFKVRMDVHSILLSKNDRVRNLIPLSTTYVRGTESGDRNGQCGVETFDANSTVPINDTSAIYESGFRCSGVYNSQSRKFYFQTTNVKGIIGNTDSCKNGQPNYVKYEYHVPDFGSSVSLDSVFQIIPYYHKNGADIDLIYNETSISGFEASFPPPSRAFALQNAPLITAPKNHSNDIENANILLQWHSLALMEKYHLQVCLDSVFSSAHSIYTHIQNLKTIADTVILDTQFTLPPLSKKTKYFWRVAGVNSEGESRWSEINDFTTGATTEVTNIPFSFSVYPNPVSDKLHISYSPSGEDINIALYDLLGNKVRSVTQKGVTSAELSLSTLSWGVYVLDLHGGNLHQSIPISIVR